MLSKVFGHPVSTYTFTHWVSWNLLLAVIPVLLGYALVAVLQRRTMTPSARTIAAILLAAAWLAFVPNTCYLLTEWKHFLDNLVGTDLYRAPASPPERVALLIQALFFVIYSGAGAVCFALAIRPVERLLRARRAPWPLIATPLFLLISLGVYLGRVRRLNSWDVVTYPARVFDAISSVLNHPLLLTLTIVFGILLWALYEALDIWVDGMAERWSNFRSRFSG